MKVAVWLAALTMGMCMQQAVAADRAPVPLPENVSEQIPAVEAATLQGRLQEPIPGAQMTSSFGWRRHPTLRRMRFHAGVDYAAPIGTTVQAAGEGVVEKIARARDRGLYLMVRHADGLVTAYSHLSAVAPGLAEGETVAAGESIARVGRSGRASGPHLDFEVFLDGMRVDPEYALASTGAPAGNYVAGKMVGFNDF